MHSDLCGSVESLLLGCVGCQGRSKEGYMPLRDVEVYLGST